MPVPGTGRPLDDRVRAAIAASHVGGLPEDLVVALTSGAVRGSAAAGEALHRAGDDSRHVELVVQGLVRVYASAPDGRTLTVRYCRAGGLMGILSLYTDPFRMPATTQAVVDTDLLRMNPVVVRGLADRDARVAKVLLSELAERASAFATEIADSAFSSVRQRVARHLLDLAAERQRGAELVAPVTQQGLAEAVGTVREVVVRTLRELRREGLLVTGRESITILSAERLLAEAYPDGRFGAGGWNTGS